MGSYLEIKSVTDGYDKKVRQDLKFRTGVFVWKVVFNIPLNPATVTNQNLTVLTSAGKEMNTKISYNADTNTIEIEPKEAYAQGEVYTLKISTKVESKGGQRLKDEINLAFSV